MIITGSDLLEKENLLETIENGLKKTEKQDYNGRIHVSSSGYCPRKGALEAKYVGDRDYAAKSALYFKLGIALEESILDSLDNQKRLFFRQYHLPETGINLGGKIDGIILYNNKIHALEIKSCGSLPSKPQLEHVSQLMVYCAVTGLPGLLLYISRHVEERHSDGSRLKMKLFEFGFDLENSKKHLANSARAYFASKNGLMPEIPDYIKSENDCGFCYFQDICWHSEPPKFLEFMGDSEKHHIENAVNSFVEVFMTKEQLQKRRNGVLKYLSTVGNKTCKLYLEDEDWKNLLLDF